MIDPIRDSVVRMLPPDWPADSDWTNVLADCFAQQEFRQLMEFVQGERKTRTVFPAAEDVFNAFRLCSYKQTRVVILGQDPYHGEGQAHGLSFSVQSGQRLPPSLRNIFKELETDVHCNNESGDLTAWARQGILLLNTVLTVRCGEANSHRKRGWETFTDDVIEKIGKREQSTVFILWGNQAIQKRNLIDTRHTVIQSPHPSPLSAHRGFVGSQPFSKTNQALVAFGSAPIDWQL